MRLLIGLLLLVIATVVSGTGNHTEFSQHLDRARDAYEAGHLMVAIEILSDAIDSLRGELKPESMTVFPEPSPGWRADPPTETPKGPFALLMGEGILRHYVDQSSAATITLSMIWNSPIDHFIHSMASGEPPPGMKTFLLGGNPGIEEQFPDRRECRLTLVVDGSLLLQARGENVSDCESVRNQLERIDMAKARKLFRK